MAMQTCQIRGSPALRHGCERWGPKALRGQIAAALPVGIPAEHPKSVGLLVNLTLDPHAFERDFFGREHKEQCMLCMKGYVHVRALVIPFEPVCWYLFLVKNVSGRLRNSPAALGAVHRLKVLFCRMSGQV